MEYFGLRFGGGPGSGRRKGSKNKRSKKKKKTKTMVSKGWAVNRKGTGVVKAFAVKGMKGKRYRNKNLIPKGYFSKKKTDAKKKLARMKKRAKVSPVAKARKAARKAQKARATARADSYKSDRSEFGRGALFPRHRNGFGLTDMGVGGAYTGEPVRLSNYRFRGARLPPKNKDRVQDSLRLSFYDGTYRANGFPDAFYPPGTKVSKFGSRFLM